MPRVYPGILIAKTKILSVLNKVWRRKGIPEIAISGVTVVGDHVGRASQGCIHESVRFWGECSRSILSGEIR